MNDPINLRDEIMERAGPHCPKRPALTFLMWDSSMRQRVHFDCEITGKGDEKEFLWRCRECPRFLLDGGRGGRKDAKLSALGFRRSYGFWVSWAR